MSKQLWLRAKSYGWGWYPVTWQGWGVLALYCVGVLANVPQSDDEVGWFVLRSGALTIILLGICYKTGEKPRWRWGKRT